MNIPKPPTARVCPAYDWCGAFPLECALEEDDAMGFDPSTMMSPSLARRGEPRELISRVQNVPNLWSSRYPSRGPLIKLFQNRGDRQVPYYVVPAVCGSAEIVRVVGNAWTNFPLLLDSEHPIDVSWAIFSS